LQTKQKSGIFRILFLSLERSHTLMFLRVQRELQNIVQAGGALDSVILDVKPLDIELPLFKKLFDKERTRSAANLIRKHKPDILVVANDQGINATFIKICRLLQIPTLALQRKETFSGRYNGGTICCGACYRPYPIVQS
jgi:hypothetical protein